jgi:CheY-like chemotaxis protein
MESKNILMIEDDKAVRDTVKSILEIQGYSVFTAADGQEGLELLRTMIPEPRLILLDLMMPLMNGWQFLDVQRNDPALKQIPVVICSAYTETAKSIKPAAFLEKPVQLPALLGAVKTLCA